MPFAGHCLGGFDVIRENNNLRLISCTAASHITSSDFLPVSAKHQGRQQLGTYIEAGMLAFPAPPRPRRSSADLAGP